MKVKVFLSNVTVGSENNEFEGLINKWLADNPGIEIQDIRFSVGVRDNSTQSELTRLHFQNATASCLILYKEAAAEEETELVGPGITEGPNIY